LSKSASAERTSASMLVWRRLLIPVREGGGYRAFALRMLCVDGCRGRFWGDMAPGALEWRQWPGERLIVVSMTVLGTASPCASACAISAAEAPFM
jgi:hypothetical protein